MKYMKLIIATILGALLIVLAIYLPARAAGEDGARDTLTATTLTNTGVAQTLSAASGDGHKFTNTGREFVVVTNAYTATVTMTVVTGGSVVGLAIADVDVALAAGATKIVGPFQTAVFNQASTGEVYLNFDAAVTGTVANSVTLAVFEME
jgi:hypothetical protein